MGERIERIKSVLFPFPFVILVIHKLVEFAADMHAMGRTPIEVVTMLAAMFLVASVGAILLARSLRHSLESMIEEYPQ